MNRPFNMPDEFVEGFMKAGASLWRSLGWAPSADRDGTMFSSTLNSSGRIAELQADHLMRLYQLTESVFKSAAGMQTEAALEPARATAGSAARNGGITRSIVQMAEATLSR